MPISSKRREADDKRLRASIEFVEGALRDGFAPPWLSNSTNSGAIAEGSTRAIEAGLERNPNSFRSRLRSGSERGIEPDWSLYKAPVYQKATPVSTGIRELITVPKALTPKGKVIKICVIGDAHDDPRLPDKSRFEWMGKWCKSEEPDVIVQLGDWATFDSVSTHHEKGSVEHMYVPTWTQDLESLKASVRAFEKGLGSYEAKRKIFIEGNHETRCSRYENYHPEIAGALTKQWRSVFGGNGWRVVDFGTYHFEEGVGFIHYPVNGAGRAYGGKTGNQRAGSDSTFTIIHGHDHRWEMASSVKIGPSRPVELISAGCSLPWGHVEGYAKLAATGWWWGVTSLTIQEGQIIDLARTSMLTLEKVHGTRLPSSKRPSASAPKPVRRKGRGSLGNA